MVYTICYRIFHSLIHRTAFLAVCLEAIHKA